MLPPLTADGVLPSGVHLAPVDERGCPGQSLRGLSGAMADRPRRATAWDRGGTTMMMNDTELLAAQARVHVIQAMLAHARRTCTPESFQDQAQGWLAEWQRLEVDLRTYLSTPATLSTLTEG